MPDTDKSMFSMINRHDKELDIHELKLEQHELELRVQAEQIKQLQDNAIKLENVVMSENRETRMTITQTNQQLHVLITDLLGYTTGQNTLKHSLTMAKWESFAKIVGILAGSGGVISGVIWWIFGQGQ